MSPPVAGSPAVAQRRINQQKFLAAYASTGNVSAAATLAAIARQTHYKWRKRDSRYAAAAAAALEEAADRLETEARRRAVSGVSKPVFYKGEKVASIQEYSDVLLIFLLKGARPEKYAHHVVTLGARRQIGSSRRRRPNAPPEEILAGRHEARGH